ncbi:MAG: chalcone isomerase family protein [Gammaproteobacteria bacterium]|nr:MAG: chalcone isomerase family protein [Gammaproteobacteria bacterium]
MMRFLTILFFFTFTALSQAAEVAGVKLPDQITSDNGTSLTLNGAGVRKKFFFKIYVAGLYLVSASTDATAILSSDQPNRMMMHFIYEEVEKEKLISGWNDGFQANLTSAELSALAPQIDKFNAMFDTMKKNDIIIFKYSPETGTKVVIRDVNKGTIPGHAFNQALLKIWLGAAPVTNGLKQSLLGK